MKTKSKAGIIFIAISTLLIVLVLPFTILNQVKFGMIGGVIITISIATLLFIYMGYFHKGDKKDENKNQ